MLDTILTFLANASIAGLPAFAAIILTFTALWYLHHRSSKSLPGDRYQQQLFSFFIGIVGIILIIITLPIKDSLKGQLLTLLGLLLTAVITLSSTTFASNAMAGLILRTLKKFRPGDFIHVGEHFGRVTEQDLFHTEIQTEDRDLTTLPNTFLLSQPYKVVHSTGTIVSASVSLGYDLDHRHVEKILVKAASAAKLNEPFVYVTDLADFSVHYRVCGFLEEVKQLISARSELRRYMLDHLHADGIEIVSPNFMNQRRADDFKAIPATPKRIHVENEKRPEDTVFDKAEKAQHIETMRDNYKELTSEVEDLSKHASTLKDDNEEKVSITQKIEKKTRRMQAIKRLIEAIEATNIKK